MAVSRDLPQSTPRSWQSRIVDVLVRARMRPHAHRPIDPEWVRQQMGRPKAPRQWMVRATGVTVSRAAASGLWPGGDVMRAQVNNTEAATMLYLHGGGYIACSPETHRPLAASLTRRLRGSAYVPSYRLAPEFPFPAALDDARAAYRHLVEVCDIAPNRIVLAGDSAGGGLALALIHALRDDGYALPACVVAFSPWTDLAATGVSLDENSERCSMFAGNTIRQASQFYLGAADPRDPYVSPLYGDFTGFPPMLLHASHDEVLRDDTIRVAERATAAGVDVEFRLWQGVPHVWQFLPAVLPEAAQSLADTTAFVARHIP